MEKSIINYNLLNLMNKLISFKSSFLLNFIVLMIKLLKIKNLFFINKLKRFLFILLFTIKETLNILPLLKLYFFSFLK